MCAVDDCEPWAVVRPRACVGIRPRGWVALILAGLASWALFAVAVWLAVGWWTS